jgi:hypothetical protein
MKSRRHGSKPTLALWMLVAVADVAVFAAAAGPVLVLVTLASLATVIAGVRVLPLFPRRHMSPRVAVGFRNAPRTEVVRRRA